LRRKRILSPTRRRILRARANREPKKEDPIAQTFGDNLLEASKMIFHIEETISTAESREERSGDEPFISWLQFFHEAYAYFTAIKNGTYVPAWNACSELSVCDGCPWFEGCYEDNSFHEISADILSNMPEESMPNRSYLEGIMDPYGCTLPNDYRFFEMPDEFQKWVNAALGFIINTAPEVVLNEQ